MAGCKLFVGSIPAANATTESLRELFEPQGARLLEVVVLPPKGADPTIRCAFVRVQDDEIGHLVCETLNGTRFEGFSQPLVVKFANNQGTEPASSAAVSAASMQQPPPPISPLLPQQPQAEPLRISLPGQNGVVGGGCINRPPAAILPPDRSSPSASQAGFAPSVATGGSSTSEWRRYMLEGRWLEIAEWGETDRASAGESHEGRVQRLTKLMRVAAVQDHWYEVAAAYETLLQLDAAAAHGACTSVASAACGDVSGVPSVSLSSQQAAVPRVVPATIGAVPVPSPMPPPASSIANGGTPSDGTVYVGMIVTFSALKHYGFISCSELGQDAFLSDKQIGTFQPGDTVAFEVGFTSQGKPQAQHLHLPGDEHPEAAAKRMKFA